MKKVINFSGGHTSALMTIMNYEPGDIVLFTDTQREHPGTYKFINDFEVNENIPVIKISHEGGFRGFLEKQNYRRLPGLRQRTCTTELKIKTAKRWLRANYGMQSYDWLVGFRYDEERRVKNYKQNVGYIKPRFPLYDQGITKEDVDEYWKNKPYKLEIPKILGNCTLCFLKGKNAIINILSVYPELADEWIKDEEEAQRLGTNKEEFRRYFKDVTYKQLRDIAQSNLFKNQDLKLQTPSFNCSCTS